MNKRIIKSEVVDQRLTKENFWDDLYQQFPEGVKVFCKWIDAWKEENDVTNWYAKTSTSTDKPLKFHDYPYAMQLGIWLDFIISRGGCTYEIENFFEFNLREDISEYLEHLHNEIIELQ